MRDPKDADDGDDVLTDYSEVEDHPLSLIGELRRTVAGRTLTPFEARRVVAHGACGDCGGPRYWEVLPPEWPTVVEADRPVVAFTTRSRLRCAWCGLLPT